MSHAYVRLTGDKENPAVPVLVEELEGTDRFRVTIGDDVYELDAFATDGRITMIRDGRSLDVAVEERGEDVLVSLPKGRARHQIMDERIYKLQVALGGGPGSIKPELVSPMAGKVVLVKAEVGQTVQPGETLLIIEAMKMENEIRAEAEATIKAIHVGAGDVIDPGAVLLEFEVSE